MTELVDWAENTKLLTYLLTNQLSPWYDRTGWLGVKHHVTYLLTYLLTNQPSPWRNLTDWLGVKTPSYLLTYIPINQLSPWRNLTGWLGVKRKVTYLLTVATNPRNSVMLEDQFSPTMPSWPWTCVLLFHGYGLCSGPFKHARQGLLTGRRRGATEVLWVGCGVEGWVTTLTNNGWKNSCYTLHLEARKLFFSSIHIQTI